MFGVGVGGSYSIGDGPRTSTGASRSTTWPRRIALVANTASGGCSNQAAPASMIRARQNKWDEFRPAL